MDLNRDGHTDILSGSYSRQTQDMAGLFQVLYGTNDGGFKKATQLIGTDGEPLIVPAEQQNMTDKICTRPFAVDLDADGHLDIITGNFGGTFFMFKGTGDGAFSPECTKLMAGDEDLKVMYHSDPFFVDWDNDGDLDILSGTGQGGVFLATNTGSKTEPSFDQFKELIPMHKAEPMTQNADGEWEMPDITLGDEHLTGAQGSTRVWVADVNDDGRLDLLVGDSLELRMPQPGVSDEDAIKAYTNCQKKQMDMSQNFPQDGNEDDFEKWQKDYQKLTDDRNKIVKVENTGFVWVYIQK